MASGILGDLVVPAVGQTMSVIVRAVRRAAARDNPEHELYPEILYDEENDQSTGSSSATTPSSWSK